MGEATGQPIAHGGGSIHTALPDLQLLGKAKKLIEGKECIETGEVQRSLRGRHSSALTPVGTRH